MTGKRPRRSTARVDYSKFVANDDGVVDYNDDEAGDEEFKLKETDEKAVSDDNADHMDVDEEEEVEELEELEDIEEVVPVTPKRKSKAPKTPKASTAKKSATPRTRVENPSDTPKVPASRRNGSLIERMGLILGANKIAQAGAINARGIWGNSMFIPQKNDMGKFMCVPNVIIKDLPPGPQVLRKESETDLKDYLLPPRSVAINKQNLESFDYITGHEGDIYDGIILNAGGFVTSLSWAPGFEGYTQYLAVGVLDDNHRDPNNCAVNSLDTSLYSRKGFPSSIYIYRMNLDPEAAESGNVCTLLSSFSHDYGSAVDLRWRMGGPENVEKSIGLLGMVSQDGYLRVLNIPMDTTLTRYRIEIPLRVFGTPGYKITCFCWRTENELTVGTDNGSIAEFDLQDISEYSAEPSFMVSVAASHIGTVSSGYPNEPNLIFEFSTDGLACIIDVRNLKSRLYSLRMKGCSMVSTYIPWASSFVATDDIFTAKAHPIRDFRAQGTINSVTAHDVTVTAVGVSNYHPFMLSGSMDGLVKIGNPIRRLLVPKRPLATTYLSATLWGLDYSTVEKAYRITNIYKTEKIGKGEAIQLLQSHPANAFVTSIEWSASIDTAEWYAAGTSSGLIRLHRLADDQSKI